MAKPNSVRQTNDNAGQNRKSLVKYILKLSEDIFRSLTPATPAIPPEWLSSDLTVAQLRVLLVLYTAGPSRMSSIASYLGIALSTATGIVDNLVKKELVLRGAASEDRRLVICQLSAQGQALVSRLWRLSQFQIERLLDGLTLDQLKKGAEVAEFLLSNVMKQNAESAGTKE
jgi:DNA-binding MarR family transcriptional regulator